MNVLYNWKIQCPQMIYITPMKKQVPPPNKWDSFPWKLSYFYPLGPSKNISFVLNYLRFLKANPKPSTQECFQHTIPQTRFESTGAASLLPSEGTPSCVHQVFTASEKGTKWQSLQDCSSSASNMHGHKDFNGHRKVETEREIRKSYQSWGMPLYLCAKTLHLQLSFHLGRHLSGRNCHSTWQWGSQSLGQ